MDALKPCPFCDHAEASEKLLAMQFVYVECAQCGAHGPMKWGAEAARNAWNHRVSPAQPMKALP